MDERRTTVLYEAPHRIERTVEDLAEALGGDRRIALCRELTKMHEEVWRGSLAEALGHVAEFEPRGEYVVVVEGAPAPDDATDETLVAALEAALASGLSRRDAAASVAAAHGVAANRTKRLVNAIEA